MAGEALEALARAGGLPLRAIETPAPPEHFSTDIPSAQTRWLETAAAALGLEVEAVDAPYGEVDRLVRGAAPALLRITRGGVPCVLALGAVRRDTAVLVAPDLTERRVRIGTIRQELCEPLEAPLAADTDTLIEEAGVDP